jgi:uncharacterized membrane protein YhhN
MSIIMKFIKNHLHFALFYLFIILCNILFFYFLTDYRMVSKPMIMASLIGFYISTAKPPANLFTFALITALFGDIFLMFPYDSFFMMGLGSFLIMQILYTISFLPVSRTPYTFQKVSVLLILAIAFLFLYFAWPNLNNMKIPVALYALCITLMVTIATTGNSTSPSYRFIFGGAVLFMISDGLLAWNKFVSSFPLADQAVMLTYMLAQFFIVSGAIMQTNEKSKVKGSAV